MFLVDTSKSSGHRILRSTHRMRASQVGGKFHRQYQMLRAGLNVPPFFVLAAEFYQAVFASLAADVSAIVRSIDFQYPEEIDRASTHIRGLFLQAGMASRDSQAVLDSFDSMFPVESLVSVRGSMIGFRAEEGEDSATNAFAGMSQSFLYVRRQDLQAKILLSMASGYSAESILYRQKQGIDLMGFSVAVGVQGMVPGSRSFVLFTCNPNTAARETLLVAGHGIGEGIVQEKVPVDHFFLNHKSDEIRRSLAGKHRMLSVAPEGHGLAMFEVPPELRAAPCLSDREIRDLAAIGQNIERLFGCPQDIEGTITSDGTVHILQSRPIVMDTRRQRVWTNANVTESFPDVTTPLTYSLARYFYRVIFHDCYRRLGIGARDLHDHHEWLDRMIGYLGGRIYYCLTSFYGLHQQSPLFPIFRAHWEKMMGFPSSYAIRNEGLLERTAHRIYALFKLVLAVFVILWRYTTHQRDIRRFHHWWESLIAPRRGRTYAHEDPLVLMTDFHEVWRQVGNHWGITLMNDTYLPLIYGWVESLFRRWALGDELLSRLLCGDEGLTSVEIILSAVRLAELVRKDPALTRLFQDHSPEDLSRMFDAGDLPSAFSTAVRAHLHSYGDRGFQELKMEQPNVRHTPWVLFRMLRNYAGQDMTAESYRARECELRRAAEADLDRRLRGSPVRKALLRVVLRTLRRLIRNRENSRYCRSELFSYSKNIFLGIAESLVREGYLHTIDDVYYSTMDELFGLIDGTGVTTRLHALADVRRAEFQQNQKRETPMEITTWGPLWMNDLCGPSHQAESTSLLRGLGSSPGRVTGIAHIVTNPNQPEEFDENGILVARETDPGWLFLMLSSRALVVERGSLLSHTAITGRKFGIPTVVAVPDATTRIPNGASIEVDGALGVVTILAPPQ